MESTGWKLKPFVQHKPTQNCPVQIPLERMPGDQRICTDPRVQQVQPSDVTVEESSRHSSTERRVIFRGSREKFLTMNNERLPLDPRVRQQTPREVRVEDSRCANKRVQFRDPLEEFETNELHVNYFPKIFTKSILLGMFQEYGIITRIVIKKHFAFVHFEKNKDALKAMERLNNQRMFGAILKVSPARRTLPKLAQPNSILRGSSGFTADVNVPSRSGMPGTSRETNYSSARCVSMSYGMRIQGTGSNDGPKLEESVADSTQRIERAAYKKLMIETKRSRYSVYYSEEDDDEEGIREWCKTTEFSGRADFLWYDVPTYVDNS